MRRKLLLIISTVAIVFTSCKEDSIAMKDYYYPLEKINEFIVYEYDREDQFDKDIDTTKLYYKIYKIDDQQYSVVSLTEQFYVGDSLVLSINNNTIMMDAYYEIYSNGLVASRSPRQELFPTTTIIGEEHSYTLVFDEANTKRYHTQIITEKSKLIDIDQDIAIFKNEMIFEQKGVKINDNSRSSSVYMVKYKKDKGLLELNSISGHVKTHFKLSRIYNPVDWKEKIAENNE